MGSYKYHNATRSRFTLQEVCLCGAQFSLQALVGTPLWICEPCGMWKN